MKTADLTGALLDYWVARAEGVPADQLEIRPLQRGNGPNGPHLPESICVRFWMSDEIIGPDEVRVCYSTNWAMGGPLVEKYKLDLIRGDIFSNGWQVSGETKLGYEYAVEGDTPLIAICRAVVRATFGDEVEDFPC